MPQHPVKIAEEKLLHNALTVKPEPALHIGVGAMGENDKTCAGTEEF